MHVTSDPGPRHARWTIKAPPYDRVHAALVTKLDRRLALLCGALTSACRAAFHPRSLTPSRASSSSARPSFPPHPSRRPLLSSFPISALTRSSFPLLPVSSYLVPPILASPPRNRALALIESLRGRLPSSVPMRAGGATSSCKPTRSLVSDRRDVKPALHTPPATSSSLRSPPGPCVCPQAQAQLHDRHYATLHPGTLCTHDVPPVDPTSSSGHIPQGLCA
jgi:hypothetical protein